MEACPWDYVWHNLGQSYWTEEVKTWGILYIYKNMVSEEEMCLQTF